MDLNCMVGRSELFVEWGRGGGGGAKCNSGHWPRAS